VRPRAVGARRSRARAWPPHPRIRQLRITVEERVTPSAKLIEEDSLFGEGSRGR
jgi:hypothetical protein